MPTISCLILLARDVGGNAMIQRRQEAIEVENSQHQKASTIVKVQWDISLLAGGWGSTNACYGNRSCDLVVELTIRRFAS